MVVKPVITERLSRKDHYRSQVNATQEVVAFCYNAMVGYLAPSQMKLIRNRLSEAVDREILYQFAIQSRDASFLQYLEYYLHEMVEPILRTEAQRTWALAGVNIA